MPQLSAANSIKAIIVIAASPFHRRPAAFLR
jgi:hypothetical protein